MTGKVHHLGARSLGATLGQEVASFHAAGRALGIPPVDWSAPKSFTFRRRRTDGVWGHEVGLQVGRFWLNLSLDAGPAPFLRSLAEARAWAVEFAERHGFAPMEQKRTPRRKPRPRLHVISGGLSDGGTR